MAQELLILPAIVWGILVGLYELFAIHKDESFAGVGRWFSHGLHAAGFAILFVFIVMNVEYALGFFPSLQDIGFLSVLGFLPFRILVGIVAMTKIQAASMVVRGGGGFAARGIGEHFTHTLIAGVLIIFGPEVMALLWPLISGFFPF